MQKYNLIQFPNNKVLQDQHKREFFQKNELKKQLLHVFIQDFSIPYQERRAFLKKLNDFPRNASKTRIKNRCVLTGRSKSVYKRFKMSRIKIRELASKGDITGLNKASW